MKWLFPKEWQDLIKYISPSSLKVIQWKSALQSLSRTGFGRNDLYRDIATNFDGFKSANLILQQDMSVMESSTSSSYKHKELLAKVVLDTYFAQFFNPVGQLLDLRLKNFTLIDETRIGWDAPGSKIIFSESFRLNMIELYEGFYREDQPRLEGALYQLGLLKESFDTKTKAAMLALLREHFAPADAGTMRFHMSDFAASFTNLFKFLFEHNCSLRGDFLFLGVYLASMYSALNDLDSELAVKEIWLGVSGRLKS